MPIIKRRDGAEFVTYSYRELIDSQRSSILKSEIRQLAANHGEYLRIYKRMNKKIEVVFGRDSGILLGESVWEYFGRPSNLIYSEEVQETEEALLVVVRAGFVYIDVNVPLDVVGDELSGVIADNIKYDVYISGNVPITNDKRQNGYVIPAEYIHQFKRLEESAFDALPLDQQFHLQPLELALRDIGVKGANSFILGACALILLIAAVWWAFRPEKPSAGPAPVKVEKTATVPAPVVPAYVKALATPDPAQVLQEMAGLANQLYFIPGWQASTVLYKDGNYEINLSRENGNLEFLQNWANQQNMQMKLTSNGASLTYRSKVSPRLAPNSVPELQSLLIQLIDRLQYLLPNSSISISAITSVTGSRQTTLTIPVSEASSNALNLLGKELTGYPIQLNTIEFSFGENLMSGTISINVLGK